MATQGSKARPQLRPIGPGDEAFLYQVYASTRCEELALTDWSQDQKEVFLRQQFDAQHQFYQEQFGRADFHIIVVDSKAAGRLYVDRRRDEIRIVDIALLPAYRNRGLGTILIKDILAEAAEAELPARIHVEHFNPALSLYHQLGFRRCGDTGVYFLLEWAPGQTAQSALVDPNSPVRKANP